jgi:hypothetical protein
MVHWSPEIANCFHPFGQEEGEAELHLQQQSDKHFTLTSGFTYKCSDSHAIHLRPGLLKETDLASVPSSMRWMVGSYGRHTFAALLHDALIRGVATTLRPLPKGPWEKRVAIDAIFFEALVCLGVPKLLSRLMWAAVTVKSRWTSGNLRRALTMLWMASVIAGTGLLVWGSLNGRWDAVALSLVLPLLGATLWGKGFRAGAFAGYGVVFVALPTGFGWLASGVYRMIERVAGDWFS